VPAGFWTVSTGLGAASPRSLLLLPVMRNEVLLGVLEIASLDPDPAPTAEVLESLLPVLATNLEALLAERRMDRLLGEARAQADASQRGGALQHWLRALVDVSPDGMLLLDAQGCILMSNEAAGAIFGYDSRALEGMHASRLLPDLMQEPGVAAGVREVQDWRHGVRGLRKEGYEVRLVVARAGMACAGLNVPGSCLFLRLE